MYKRYWIFAVLQDLTVTVMSERSTREIEISEDPEELHRVNKQSFIDEQEWHLYKVHGLHHAKRSLMSWVVVNCHVMFYGKAVGCFLIAEEMFHLFPHTLNKKSLNGQGNSMTKVLRRKFLVQWRNFHVFSWVFYWVIPNKILRVHCLTIST